MTLTKLERKNIVNQLLILEKLYPEEAKYYEEHRIAFENGYTSHYEDYFEGLYDEMSDDECREVLDVLDMYSALHFSFRQIKNSTSISKEDIKFIGFDGNHETSKMSYTRYFLHDLDRYKELHGSDGKYGYNSHGFKTMSNYRKMLLRYSKYNDIKKNQLDENAILDILGK